MHDYWVYILTNLPRRTVLYIGMTNSLEIRLAPHRAGVARATADGHRARETTKAIDAQEKGTPHRTRQSRMAGSFHRTVFARSGRSRWWHTGFFGSVTLHSE